MQLGEDEKNAAWIEKVKNVQSAHCLHVIIVIASEFIV